MPGNHYAVSELDVEVNIFADLYLTRRKRWSTVGRLTDEPGPATRQLYTSLTAVSADFPQGSPFYKFASRFFQQQPTPRELLYIPVPRTAGRPATDWSLALDEHRETYGNEYYLLTAYCHTVAEQKEVADWCAATGGLGATIFIGTNFAGEASYLTVGKKQVSTLTLDAALITGNTISAKINGGTAITQVFDTDSDTTLAAFAVKLAAHAVIDTAVVTEVGGGTDNDRVITLTALAVGVAFTVTEAAVTGGASQAGVVAATTTVADGFKVTSRFQGYKGDYDNYQVTRADDPANPGNPKPSASLDVKAVGQANGGTKVLVEPATDGAAVITSTYAQVVARINADADSSFLFRADLLDNCVGATLIAEQVATALASGGVNEDFVLDEDDKVDVSQITERGELIDSTRVAFYVHSQPSDYYTEVGGINGITKGAYPDAAVCAFASVRNPGSYTLDKKPIEGVPNSASKVLYGDRALSVTNRMDLRAAMINIGSWTTPVDLDVLIDDHTLGNMWLDVRMAIDVETAWQIEGLWYLLSVPPGGVGKVPYYDDGFKMIQAVIWRTLRRGMLPEWNFIAYDPATMEPAARITAPKYIDIYNSAPELITEGHYPLTWRATFKGAVRSIQVTGYLTIEFIPSSQTVFTELLI